MNRYLAMLALLLASFCVWGAEPDLGNMSLQNDDRLIFKNDADIESAYQKMVLVVVVFVTIFAVLFVSRKKIKLFNGLVDSVRGNGSANVIEIKRISSKTIIYVLNVKGEEKVVVESTANIIELDLSKESNINNEA